MKGIVRKEAILAVSLIDTETVEKARSIHDTYPTASAALGRVISGALLLACLSANKMATASGYRAPNRS